MFISFLPLLLYWSVKEARDTKHYMEGTGSGIQALSWTPLCLFLNLPSQWMPLSGTRVRGRWFITALIWRPSKSLKCRKPCMLNGSVFISFFHSNCHYGPCGSLMLCHVQASECTHNLYLITSLLPKLCTASSHIMSPCNSSRRCITSFFEVT